MQLALDVMDLRMVNIAGPAVKCIHSFMASDAAAVSVSQSSLL